MRRRGKEEGEGEEGFANDKKVEVEEATTEREGKIMEDIRRGGAIVTKVKDKIGILGAQM